MEFISAIKTIIIIIIKKNKPTKDKYMAEGQTDRQIDRQTDIYSYTMHKLKKNKLIKDKYMAERQTDR